MTTELPRSCSRGAAPPGIVTLNRPKALNAVTHDMVRALRASSTHGPRPPR
jgi:enoyl-CoA hydratase/carnithine racemase